MDQEIKIEPLFWQAPEYTHKEKSVDFFWTVGLITIIGVIIALWLANYVFAVFILVSGGCLIMFSLRPPLMMDFSIGNDGLKVGKDSYPWKGLRGWNMVSGSPYSKLLVETSRYFLPVYTIPVPEEIASKVRESFAKIVPVKEIEESRSMTFGEKLGF